MSILSLSLLTPLSWMLSCQKEAAPDSRAQHELYADSREARDSASAGESRDSEQEGGLSQTQSWSFGEDWVTVTSTEDDEGRRHYTLSSTHPMRDDGPSERSFTEQSADPILRSGVLLTDALFAMAVEEARENAVSQLSDGAFEGSVDCECYQTGALWNWVWTRDIAYATELGLAWLDPERAANSLLFKLSELKEGGGLQIVQDTGTGGSWPVSTDRVTWARGAMAVLRVLDHSELREAAIEAMRNTAELDRLYAWDARDGLYRGETSFLDWREQSYPAWTAQNVGHIGMSKSLSTNLGHLFLLRSLEELTGEDHQSEPLAQAIDEAFWQEDHYSSYLMTELDPSPVQRQDLLGTALAVLDLGTHPEALEGYPFGEAGPPVIWPQQQYTPIYHNRASWPFVTAYALLAARAADNGAVFDASLEALVRGAALNLSHMENFELVTGANWLEDGDYSGPVVNSRRQLWSVAGFVGAVMQGVFGLGEGETGSPILPGVWFTEGASLRYGGEEIAIGEARLGEGSMTSLDSSDWRQLYGAGTPEVTLEGEGDRVTLSFTGDEGASFSVYRDGEPFAAEISSPWSDSSSVTRCYSIQSRLIYASQPSEPQCWWGDDYDRIQTLTAEHFSAKGGSWSTNYGRGHYENWGAPEHTLTLTMRAEHSGEHLLQLVFGNGAGGVDTGVTAAVKWAEVTRDGAMLTEGPLVMPHQGDWERWTDSSFLPMELRAGDEIQVLIRDGFNMSFLEHYRHYQGGAGGGESPYNYVNIAEVKLLFLR